MTKKLFIEAISQDHLVALFRDTLQFRQELESPDLAILNESVRDFLARNAGPFCALLNNPGFVENYAALTQELLLRAHGLAAGPDERKWIQEQAVKAGFESLFPPVERSTAPMTKSQACAFEQLQALATLHFRGTEKYGVQLRTTPLVVGPSGVGKTHLVEQLGKALHLEVVRFTVGDWIVTGSRHDPHTLRQIHSRIRQGKKLVLQIDELDKFRNHPSDAWGVAQLAEIFAVLDRRVAGGTWTEDDRQKLKRDVFIVGSGTWQDVWREQGVKPVGFAQTTGSFDLERKIRKAQAIPDELLNRFNGEWLILEPLGVADFEQIARELKLGPAILDPSAAAAGGLNYRAVENALTAAALTTITREMREALSDEIST